MTRVDKLAKKPAVGFGYQMPKRGTPEYYAMGLLDQILVQGEDSMLYQELVKNKNYTSGVSGGINGYLGNMFNYNGPMLFSVDLIHDEKFTPQEILAASRRRDRAGAGQAGRPGDDRPRDRQAAFGACTTR